MPPSITGKFCTNYHEYDNIVLKGETSIVDPVFELRDPLEPYNINYIYVPKLNRGYWVSDYAYSGGVWLVSAHVDVLGSFTLPQNAQYITRTSKDYNTNIVDAYVKLTGWNRTATVAWDWPFAESVSQGRFVVGIISKQGGQYGATTYYSMNSTQLNRLMANLMGDVGYMGISTSEISQGLQRGLINPIQYISSCMWVPWIPETSGTVTNIDCGWWTFPVAAGIISSPQMRIEFFRKTFALHPQTDVVGKWINAAPYMDVKLFAPPWGIIDLPLNVIDTQYISYDNPPAVGIQCFADAISGMASLDVSLLVKRDETWYTMGQIAYNTTQLGITIPLAQSSQNAYTAGVSAMYSAGAALGIDSKLKFGTQPRTGGGGMTLGGGAGRNYVSSDQKTGVIDTVKRTALRAWNGLTGWAQEAGKANISAIADAAGAKVNPLNVVGSSGSYLNVGRSWTLTATYNSVVPVDNDNMGKPYCKYGYLSDFNNSYVEVANAHYVSRDNYTPPSVVEMEEYETALASGVFIENGQ